MGRKHGEEGTPLYIVWSNMRARCRNPKHRDYHRYGGRGITVCACWNEYRTFAADVGPHPGNDLTLDRKDNNDGYRPGNVRWATKRRQARNTRKSKLTDADVANIRAMYRPGLVRQVDIAAIYCVHQTLISAIVRGACWR